MTWDHGVYDWAIPQLYGEVAFGDWSVKVGHFFTPAGYEVIPATGNFFYSHSLTSSTASRSPTPACWAPTAAATTSRSTRGWTLGWDTGFDQFGDGNNFLGGFGVTPVDDVDVHLHPHGRQPRLALAATRTASASTSSRTSP